jgi:hypothetical protein
MKNKLYRWQEIVLWIMGIWAVISNVFMRYFFGGQSFYLSDLQDLIIIAIFLLILWLLFKVGNWIYLKIKKNKNNSTRP